MDPMQALQVLDQIVSQVPMNRQQTLTALKAVQVIREALQPKPADQ